MSENPALLAKAILLLADCQRFIRFLPDEHMEKIDMLEKIDKFDKLVVQTLVKKGE